MYLIGAQHFDLSIHDVWEKLAEISQMRDVIARDLWDSTNSAHAQIIDINSGNYSAKQVGTLLLTARHVYAVSKADGDIPESHPQRKELDEKIYNVLSERLRDTYDIFGSLPDIIDDEWITDEAALRERIYARTAKSTGRFQCEVPSNHRSEAH